MNLNMQMCTKYEEVQAFVEHVFIDQYLFLSLRATSQQSHQIPMLKLGYELNFIFELYQTLS